MLVQRRKLFKEKTKLSSRLNKISTAFQSPKKHVWTGSANAATETNNLETLSVVGDDERESIELASDINEQMKDYEECSSDTGSTNAVYDHLHSYQYLSSAHCWVKTSVKTTKNLRLTCVCGKRSTDCNRHASQPLKGLQNKIGYYKACVTIQGNHVHGIYGTYVSVMEYNQLREAGKEGMKENVEANVTLLL